MLTSPSWWPGDGLRWRYFWRTLAVLDAVYVQALGVYWVSTWPDRGAAVGFAVTFLLVFWALKRAWGAAFRLETYRWMTGRLLRWGVVLVGAALALQAARLLVH